MKILIIKIGALGDVLRTTFLAQALKDKYHNVNPEIFWITSKQAEIFFQNNPYVDNIISSEKRKSIMNINFDLIINLEESFEDCLFASSLKSKKILGAFANKSGKIDYTPESSYWFDMSRISKSGKIKADILKKKNRKTHREIFSEMIRVNTKKYEPFFRLTKNQREIANSFLKKNNLLSSNLIIGLNLGAADRWPKALPINKSISLIEKIYKKYNAKIVLLGGPNEIDRNKEILRKSKVPVIDAGCNNSLNEFISIVSACNLLITTDSLGLHISLALKRKTICLVGPTSPYELDLYGLGEKIIAKSKDVCSYKTETNCMGMIDINEVEMAIFRRLNEKISILITAFNEPEIIGKAIESAIKQKTSRKYDIIVSAPDNPTINEAKKYQKKAPNLTIWQDPGKGKSFALNQVFARFKTDLLILTDGDVFISDQTVENFSNLFLNPEIGCISGRPVPLEDKKTLFGYWANFLFNSAHKIRKKASLDFKFLECSGYLFAFRKNLIEKIPLDVAEDTIIPYMLWEKGYGIGYSPNSKVYVRNPKNFNDWVKQKIRTAKAHEKIKRYVNLKFTKKIKSFKTESKGLIWLFTYPEKPIELWWSICLGISRLYVWTRVFYDTKIIKNEYGDGWDRIESTKH